MRRFVSAASLAAGLSGCGDGGPSGSSGVPATTTAPASIVFTVVSGESGSPVGRATLIVAGATHSTDENGNVSAGTLRAGATIDVIAPNFFDRQTLYGGPTATRLSLWPRTTTTGLTPELTQRLVYTALGEDAIPGEVPLRRPPLGSPIQVFLEPAIAGDSRVNAVVDESIAALRDALQGGVDFLVTGTMPSSGVVWSILIDPSAISSDFIASWSVSATNFEIVGATLRFRTVHDLADNGRLLTSMMGHTFGLRDSNDPNDRMFFDWWRRRPNDFSPKEALIMRLMLQRRAGNRWPDNDRSLGLSAQRQLSNEGFERKPPTGQ